MCRDVSQRGAVEVGYGLVANGLVANGGDVVSTVAVSSSESKGTKQTGSSTLAGSYTAHRVSTIHVVVSRGDMPLMN